MYQTHNVYFVMIIFSLSFAFVPHASFSLSFTILIIHVINHHVA